MSRKTIAIDINEVIRSHWSAIEEHYPKFCTLMGIEPEIVRPFNTYNYLNHFIFKERIVDAKYLKEILKELPKELYHIKDENGNYKSDTHLFDNVKETLTPENQLHKFIYEEYLWEVFGNCGKSYTNAAQDVNEFYKKNKENFDIKIVSLEEHRSIPPTLFFLSKTAIQIADYSFYGDQKRLWKECDVLITTNPKLLDIKPSGKLSIKIEREFNTTSKADLNVLNMNDLVGLDLKTFTKSKFNFFNLFK